MRVGGQAGGQAGGQVGGGRVVEEDEHQGEEDSVVRPRRQPWHPHHTQGHQGNESLVPLQYDMTSTWKYGLAHLLTEQNEHITHYIAVCPL